MVPFLAPCCPQEISWEMTLSLSQMSSQFHAEPCPATRLKFSQEMNEWMPRCHSRLNPCNFNFLYLYRLAKGRCNFLIFFKGMNPVAVGDGLHWSNFLFTIEKKKALGLLESFSEKAQKKQVILLSLISSSSFLPLHMVWRGLFDICSSIWGCFWH